MDLVSAAIGFVVGIIATAFAVEFGLKKLFAPPDTTTVTSAWRLSEFSAPFVATTGPLPERLPHGARVLVSEPVDARRYPGAVIRRTSELRGDFAVEAEGDRALLPTGGFRPGTLAAITVEGKVATHLRQEFARMWARAEVHVEELEVRELAGKEGLNVRTVGTVTEVTGYKGGHLLRLADGIAAIGVWVDEPIPGAVGRRIAVTGRLVRGASGYPLLDARGGELPRATDEPPARTAPTPGGRSAPAGSAASREAPARRRETLAR